MDGDFDDLEKFSESVRIAGNTRDRRGSKGGKTASIQNWRHHGLGPKIRRAQSASLTSKKRRATRDVPT